MYLLNVEEMEGRWIAHVDGLWGCFASAEQREAALAAVPAAVHAYWAWQRQHGGHASEPGEAAATASAVTSAINEVHRAWNSRPDYEVNAFFASDRAPLSPAEASRAAQHLAWTRADLLASVAGLSEGDLAREAPPAWPIGGILNHVARAENWYLGCLDLGVAGLDAIRGVFDRPSEVRERLLGVLPGLAGDDRLVVRDGEVWTARKMLRRAVWHERDHTEHIRQVRATIMGG